MDKVTAVTLLEFADRATAGLKSAVDAVKQAAPGRGADFFESGVNPIWGTIVIGLMAPVWDQHPDLVPVEDAASDGGYDPDFFNLPREVVIRAAQSLSQVQRLVIQVEAFLAGADLPPDERDRLAGRLNEIRSDLHQTHFNVSNQHPDFRGAYPKETIPE